MINRDGFLKSLWQDGVLSQPINSTDSTAIYDVAIVGGGITGVSLALQLQKEGKKCILIEAANLCFGTTGGTTAHINTLLDTPYTTIAKNFGDENATIIANAAKDAVELIKTNIKYYDIDCGFEEADAYTFAETDDEVKDLDEIFIASAKVDLPIAYTSEIPVPIPFKKAFKVGGQAKFHPTRYVYALAAEFVKAGGTVLEQCRVTDMRQEENVQIETTLGTFEASKLVFATHIPIGVNLLHLRCAPYRTYVIAVTLKDKDAYPEELIYDSKDPYYYYRTQKVDGLKYLIVGGEDHKTAHEPDTEKCFRDLEAHVRKYYDIEEVSYKWSSQYFEPTDGIPYIGLLPGYDKNIYVATGFGGNGMTYSGVATLALTELILHGKSAYKDIFNPYRVKPIAGFVNFIKENADVVKKLVGSILPSEKLKDLANLSLGEGKVVKYDGQTVGLYRDENGMIHAVNPTCTHMKCTVEWNPAEKSWDCPCHGGRFDCNGNILTGPVSENLEKISIEHV